MPFFGLFKRAHLGQTTAQHEPKSLPPDDFPELQICHSGFSSRLSVPDQTYSTSRDPYLWGPLHGRERQGRESEYEREGREEKVGGYEKYGEICAVSNSCIFP